MASEITPSDREEARREAAALGIRCPEWAKSLYKPKDWDWSQKPDHKPTSYERAKCRKYCEEKGIQVPDWAAFRNLHGRPKDPRIEPDTVTQSAIDRCRKFCRALGMEIPAWAGYRKRKIAERRVEQRGRDRFSAALVWTDVTLALRSGMDDFWVKAESEVECLEDAKLTEAVKAHSPDACAEAMRVILEIDPLFGRHTEDRKRRRGGDMRPFYKADHERITAGSSSEQRQAWASFCKRNGLKDTTDAVRRASGGDSDAITRTARFEFGG